MRRGRRLGPRALTPDGCVLAVCVRQAYPHQHVYRHIYQHIYQHWGHSQRQHWSKRWGQDKVKHKVKLLGR